MRTWFMLAALILGMQGVATAETGGFVSDPEYASTKSGIKIEVVEFYAWCLHGQCRYERLEWCKNRKCSGSLEISLTVKMTNLSEKDPKHLRPCNLELVFPDWYTWGLIDHEGANAIGAPIVSSSVNTWTNTIDSDCTKEIAVEKEGWILVNLYGKTGDGSNSPYVKFPLRYEGDDSFEIWLTTKLEKCDRDDLYTPTQHIMRCNSTLGEI